jgi:hypothetical protein
MNISKWIPDFIDQMQACEEGGLKFFVKYHDGYPEEGRVAVCDIDKNNCNISTCPLLRAAKNDEEKRLDSMIEGLIDNIDTLMVIYEERVTCDYEVLDHDGTVEQLNCRVERLIHEHIRMGS